MAASVYSRAVEKAAALIGGQEQLATYLGVSPEELRKWMADMAKPPLKTFLRIVDLIIDETPLPESDDPEPPPARDAAPSESRGRRT